MKNKRGYEFSFAWIFAIMVGAIILFLAIYVTTQIVGLERFKAETKTGKKIGILLNPIATNLEQAKFATIIVPDETIIFNNCTEPTSFQPFGSQGISISARQGNLRNENADIGAKSRFHDRYLFSNPEVEGKKEFYVLSKPFKFPFKVADLMILWSDKESYCFVNPPTPIENDIDRLNLEDANIRYTNSLSGECLTAKTVCFSSTTSGCDINVNTNQNVMSVTHKNQQPIYYAESFDNTDKYALLYAAIFSNPQEYECQVKRLMERASQLAILYKNKAGFYDSEYNCASDPKIGLAYDNYIRDALTLTNSIQLHNMASLAEDVKQDANPISCRLF